MDREDEEDISSARFTTTRENIPGTPEWYRSLGMCPAALPAEGRLDKLFCDRPAGHEKEGYSNHRADECGDVYWSAK